MLQFTSFCFYNGISISFRMLLVSPYLAFDILVRLTTGGKNLPHSYSKTPNITFGRKALPA